MYEPYGFGRLKTWRGFEPVAAAERRAPDENIFRGDDERLERLGEEFGDSAVTFLCECSDRDLLGPSVDSRLAVRGGSRPASVAAYGTLEWRVEAVAQVERDGPRELRRSGRGRSPRGRCGHSHAFARSCFGSLRSRSQSGC